MTIAQIISELKAELRMYREAVAVGGIDSAEAQTTLKAIRQAITLLRQHKVIKERKAKRFNHNERKHEDR